MVSSLTTPQQRPAFFSHQIEGAHWLAGKERAGIFDKMGLGKTATIIHGLDLLGYRRGIVITTATSKENWRREFLKWQGIPRVVVKWKDDTTFVDWLKGKSDVIILSYDMAARKHLSFEYHMNEASLHHRRPFFFEFGVMDEAHNAKNLTAARTVAVRGPASHGGGGIFQRAFNIWEATGTPIPNDPIDIWAFLRFTGSIKMPRYQFVNDFLYSRETAHGSRQTVKPEMLGELRRLLTSVSIMRTEGPDIPPILVSQSFIDGDTTKVEQFIRDHPGIDRAIIDALEQGNLNLISATHKMTLARLIGEAKALPFAHQLVEMLHGGLDKAVVFGHHISVLRMVMDKLDQAKIKYVHIDGSTSQNKRNESVDLFQSDSKYRVFLGNIKAAGEAITLTAANHLFMLESLWTPKDNAQPIMRISRIGQLRNTFATFVTLAGSFDESIIRIVQEKVRNITAITDKLLLAAPQ